MSMHDSYVPWKKKKCIWTQISLIPEQTINILMSQCLTCVVLSHEWCRKLALMRMRIRMEVFNWTYEAENPRSNSILHHFRHHFTWLPLQGAGQLAENMTQCLSFPASMSRAYVHRDMRAQRLRALHTKYHLTIIKKKRKQLYMKANSKPNGLDYDIF